ncbi:MAG: Hsp20/alpha crystallin family protein [Planctomycetes bacterium]|nr:Hsp20/alpha crystallin family protein [Planctomycetota bacterium]
MHDFHRMLLSAEVRELSDEVSRLFDELDRAAPGRRAVPAGTCAPLLDVLETDTAIEIVVDLPGVAPDRVRVLIKHGVVLLVGEKLPPDPAVRADATFHLVERGFGRFARAVRLAGAVDAARAWARYRSGELRIAVPKIAERRGQEIAVPVENEAG